MSEQSVCPKVKKCVLSRKRSSPNTKIESCRDSHPRVITRQKPRISTVNGDGLNGQTDKETRGKSCGLVDCLGYRIPIANKSSREWLGSGIDIQYRSFATSYAVFAHGSDKKRLSGESSRGRLGRRQHSVKRFR